MRSLTTPCLIMSMALITVRPTQLDKDIARGIARHTDVPIERGAEVLTWGADEHLLIAAAAHRPAAPPKIGRANTPAKHAFFGMFAVICGRAAYSQSLH